MNAQGRQAAIEAGARAARRILTHATARGDINDYLLPDVSEADLSDLAREVAAAVIDAAAPHLAGEPVGYALLDCDGEPFCNIDGLDDARDYAQWLNEPKSGDFNRPYRVVALVPVDTP